VRGLSRVRGLVALLGDVVEHGSRAVEEVHASTAARGFAVAEWVAPSPRVRAVRAAHDLGVALSYEGVRVVTRAARSTLTLALDVAEIASPPRDAG